MTPKQVVMLVGLTFLVLTVLVVAVSLAALVFTPEQVQEVPMSTAVTPQEIFINKSRFVIPGNAYLDGRDIGAMPPLTVMQINIWNAMERTEVICQSKHGTPIKLIDAEYSEAEERYYFLVKVGQCQGWISENFISDRKWAPVGDKFDE